LGQQQGWFRCRVRLTQAGASQVRALSGIADVQADAVITLDAPIAKAEADVSDVANPSINSQENPAAGVRAFWQWNMRLIGADKAWAAHKLGDAGVTVRFSIPESTTMTLTSMASST